MVKTPLPISQVGRDVPSAPLPISSKDLTNKQLDRVAALFKLLINPDDIDAWLNWENPAIADKARLIHSIKNAAPFAYIDTICKRKFGHRYESPFYEDLPLQDLLNLRRTLSQRTQHGAKPIQAPQALECGSEVRAATAFDKPKIIDVSRNTPSPEPQLENAPF